MPLFTLVTLMKATAPVKQLYKTLLHHDSVFKIICGFILFYSFLFFFIVLLLYWASEVRLALLWAANKRLPPVIIGKSRKVALLVAEPPPLKIKGWLCWSPSPPPSK